MIDKPPTLTIIKNGTNTAIIMSLNVTMQQAQQMFAMASMRDRKILNEYDREGC